MPSRHVIKSSFLSKSSLTPTLASIQLGSHIDDVTKIKTFLTLLLSQPSVTQKMTVLRTLLNIVSQYNLPPPNTCIVDSFYKKQHCSMLMIQCGVTCLGQHFQI